jgi:hypothetical protein
MVRGILHIAAVTATGEAAVAALLARAVATTEAVVVEVVVEVVVGDSGRTGPAVTEMAAAGAEVTEMAAAVMTEGVAAMGVGAWRKLLAFATAACGVFPELL